MPNKQVCTECGEPSIPGLARGAGKCQYHWNAGVWGKAWADKVRADEQAKETAQPPEFAPGLPLKYDERGAAERTFYVATDAVQTTIKARDADDAAAKFAAGEGMPGINTETALRVALEGVGGWLTLYAE